MSALGRRWLLVALLIGLAARLAALPLPGTRDVLDWKATAFIASTDLLGVYGKGGWPADERRLLWDRAYATTEYPPIDQLEMAMVGRVYRFFDPQFRDSRLLSALIKLPGLIAELIFVVALLTWGRRVLGESAVWAATAFWLNPAVWLASAVDGYLDAQMAVPAALAFLAVVDHRPRLAGALIGIAVLTKPQALFIVPVLAVMLVRRDGRMLLTPLIAAALASLVVAVAAFLPYALAGTLPSLLRALQRFGEHDLVSGNATNLWWLLTWAAGSVVRLAELGWAGALSRPATMVRISTAVAQGIPNPRTVGLLLTVASIGWSVWRCRRGVSAPVGALVGAWCVIAYFMLAGQVHENHSYLALPFLAIAAGALPQLRRLYWLISAAFILNLYLFYGFGESLPPVISRNWTFVDMSVLLSVVYFGLAIWMTSHVIARTAQEPRS